MVLRDGILHTGGQRVPCVVRNISSGGLMARVYQPVELGDTVGIELAGGRVHEGEVLWEQDWEVGIAFSRPIDVEAVLADQWAAEDPGDRRSRRRIEISCPATLKIRMRFHYGKVCDLSPTGARVRTQGVIKKIGDSVLMLPGLPPLPAEIRWTRERDCGLSFREHIPVEALANWLEERSSGSSADLVGESGQG
jgi:hypothetical protein